MELKKVKILMKKRLCDEEATIEYATVYGIFFNKKVGFAIPFTKRYLDNPKITTRKVRMNE